MLKKKMLKGLSLFSNIGISEALLHETEAEIVIANEIDKNRCKFYENIYPETKVICGDIRNLEVYRKIASESIKMNVDFILATPPCQGMSTIGKQHLFDERNQLIYYAINIIKNIKPKYVLIENIPQQLKTIIKVQNSKILIPNYIKEMLEDDYFIEESIINAADYGVPQIRKRSIFLLTRKDIKILFEFLTEDQYVKHINLSESIGHLPSLDPKIQELNLKELLRYFPKFLKKEEEGLKISKWHRPPVHKLRHVEVMSNTPEGKSALFNETKYPKNKDGSRVKGYKNTYKRQFWNRPAYTVTTYNGAICSQDNVHPGKPIFKENENLFSDSRVFSIYELLIVMTIPKNWNIPDWANDSLIRHSIGEGLPPLIVKKLFNKLSRSHNEK
tara:strand:+ start:100 stop:1263 length:1164 start_codon:yes stop_codon:yes gene_type:complete